MKRKIIIITIMICLYLLFFGHFHIGIPCLFNKLTGLYCPGCGLTRMLVEILNLNFYQAFRYNMLLFVLFPFFIFYIVNYIYAIMNNKEPMYKRIPSKIIYALIIVLIIFGILRNIFPFLAPIEI